MTVDREHPNKTTQQIPEGLIFGCAILLAVVLVSFPIVGWVTYLRYGMPGVAASAVAAFVCGSAAIMALVFTIVTRNTPNAVAGLFFSIFLRTCVPLLAALILSNSGGPLSAGGVFGQIVVFYLLLLPVETVLAVRLMNRMTKGAKVS
ncbi:MAG: hypothetical protein IH899_07815 [Planctomycetes bacterium]|nr:hypothetical protein [Planctomycetota bacterium]